MAPSRLEQPPSPSGLSAQPGQVLHLSLGRTYRLQRALAPRASTGAVWSALWLQTQAQVALKWLPPDTPAETFQQQRETLEREAVALACCQHPHLVRLHTVGRLPDGEAVLVLEQLHEPLHQRLLLRPGEVVAPSRRVSASRPAAGLPMADALRLAHQLAMALQALHASGWRHLDVKPSNLLLSPPGPLGQRLKLADLGACTPLSQPVHTFLGTPGWMAPEQCQPLADGAPSGRPAHFATDARTDVFAVGQLLYYLVTAEGTAWARQSHAASRFGALVGLRPAQASGCALSDAELDHLDTLWHRPPPPAPDCPASEAFREAPSGFDTNPTWHAAPAGTRAYKPHTDSRGGEAAVAGQTAAARTASQAATAATPLRRVLRSLCALEPQARCNDMLAASKALHQLRLAWLQHTDASGRHFSGNKAQRAAQG